MQKIVVISEPSLLLFASTTGEKFIVYPNSQRYRVVGDKQQFQKCLMRDLFSLDPVNIIGAKNILTIMECFTEIEGEV